MKISTALKFKLKIILFFISSSMLYGQVINYADSVIAFSSEWEPSNPTWNAIKALGLPDKYPAWGEDGNTSYSPGSANNSREFLELYFNNNAPINSVWVYETLGAGATDSIYVKNPNTNDWELVWSGTAYNHAYSRLLKAEFPTTSFPVTDVRIAINCPAVSGWQEYDAVAIVTATPLTESICNGDSILINETYRKQANTYTDTIGTGIHRDIVKTTLNVTTVNTSIQQNNETLTSLATPATYQWINCATGIISGETNVTFTAIEDGNYAVEVIQNSCIDTSDCINIQLVSTPENLISAIQIYPNPASNKINIVFKGMTTSTIKIFDINGKISANILNTNNNKASIDISKLQTGNYIITIEDKSGIYKTSFSKH
jgi:hypothetical protein